MFCHFYLGNSQLPNPATSTTTAQVHADIWGGADHPKHDRVRFPHLLWKRQHGVHVKNDTEHGVSVFSECTTEIVPGGFTRGNTDHLDYRQISRARAGA